MIRCPYTRDAVRQMLPIFPKDDEYIARRVSNSAYSVTANQVRAMRRTGR